MHKVWRFALPVNDVVEVEMPAGAELLTVAWQDDNIFHARGLSLWVRVDPAAPKEVKRFAVVGTGHPAPEPEEGKYVGTAFLWNGVVVHVFEQVPVLKEVPDPRPYGAGKEDPEW